MVIQHVKKLKSLSYPTQSRSKILKPKLPAVLRPGLAVGNYGFMTQNAQILCQARKILSFNEAMKLPPRKPTNLFWQIVLTKVQSVWRGAKLHHE